jgi:hypothetical protein
MKQLRKFRGMSFLSQNMGGAAEQPLMLLIYEGWAKPHNRIALPLPAGFCRFIHLRGLFSSLSANFAGIINHHAMLRVLHIGIALWQ